MQVHPSLKLKKGDKILGRKYLLKSTLGKGQQSKVKLGIRLSDGMTTAIKVHYGLAEEDKVKLAREVLALQNLEHPNIVRLVDSFAEALEEKLADPAAMTFEAKTKNAEYIICLEHAGGRDLIQVLMHTGKFDEDTGRFYFRQLIEGIKFIHDKGMVHRDLKPDNLLFDDEFRMKVADFGTVGSLHKQAVLSTFCGTENYMAPEVLASYEERKQYEGEPVDVFSCGVILFIMVVGSMPFQIATPDNDLYKYIHQGRWKHFWRKYQSMQGGLEEVPESFLKLIEGLLANNVADRMTTAQVMASEWYNGPIPDEGQVHEIMITRKREVEARIKAEKQAKKE
jgi:serine/threonine protein kinase